MTSLTSPRKSVASLLSLALPACALLVACGGSVKASGSAEAKTGADARAGGDVEFEVEPDGSGANETAWDEVEETQDAAETSEAATASKEAQRVPLLGARHDLLLREGISAKCKCLAVILGQPQTPGLVWTGREPQTDTQTQLVIALGSEGITCDEEGTGASYMGYEMKDGNVVVSVEAAVSGRPIAHGAIIPRPAPGKAVLIQPVGKIPYGKSLSGEGLCSLEPSK